MSQLSPEINAAIMQFRNRCPESYPDATSEELICSMLWSAGLFGRMAAKEKKRAEDAEELNKELRIALRTGMNYHISGTGDYAAVVSVVRRAIAKAEGNSSEPQT